jgi:hypothetical protein
MTSPQRFIPWVLPVAGMIFFVLWVIAEAGRVHGAGFYLVIAGYGLAIALAKVVPSVAVGLIMAIPVGMLIGILSSYESTTWPVAIASLMVGFVVALYAKTLTRWVALGVGVVQAVLVAFVIVMPSVASPDQWESWVGIPEDMRGTSQTLVGGMIVAAVLYALAWTAGLAVRLNTRPSGGWLLTHLPSWHSS